MVKSKEKNKSAIRIAVIACGLLLGVNGGRLIRSSTMAGQVTHSMPAAYTQSDGDTIVEYSSMTTVACVNDL